jgi:PAS domain S-box-containing protein
MSALPPLRILHVEDNPADAELAQQELRKDGLVFECKLVETRAAFLDMLWEFRPDLILSDYKLPEFDGMTALVLAREHAPDVPVIITTGSLNEETAVACMKAGAADYVLKDSLGRLGTAVRSALERQRLVVEKRADEQRIRGLNRLLRTITEANQLLVRATDEESLLKDVCRILVSRGGYALTWVGRADKETMRVVPVASAGNEAEYLQRIEVRWDETPEGRGPLGIAIREGRSVIVSDVQADPMVVPWRKLHPSPGFGSIAAIPIRRGGAVTAGLIVYAWEIGFVDEEEVGLLEELAEDLSFALDALDARENLRESEERYRSLFATSLDAVLLTAPGGEILAANAAACRMLGRSEEELMRAGRDAVVDRSDPRLPAALEKCARTGNFHGELTCLRKDLTKFTAELCSAVFTNRHGQPRTSMVIHDITERRQLEAQFRQAQKMEAVGRLAGGVAHDFNNLLTVIQGYGELMQASVVGDPEKRESVGEIVKAAERASALTRQLLAFSRQQVLELCVLDVGAVVVDTEKMLKRLIGEDVEVVVVKPQALGRVKADPGQIEQVVLNLAVNARDAMPGGGRLTLELADADLDAPLAAALDSIPPGRYVVLSITDTGTGMDAETLGHIFEPFFTTKEKGKGTGLGLATVYGIVRQTGGYIAVETAPGAGTTFRIYLPRCAEPMTSGIRPSVLSRDGTETVLLVEDEPAVRVLVQAILKRHGYSLLVAENGTAALDVVARDPRLIHVLLTDLVMPGMNGRELASRVTALRPSIKVVFMSGYRADVLTGSDIEAGQVFISKPFNERALAAKLREALDAPQAAAR